MSEFAESLFICAAIVTGLGLLVIFIHGIGLIVMKLMDRGRPKLTVVRRVP
jgi:uncharacterized membrane protein YhaH (DUF805 family)